MSLLKKVLLSVAGVVSLGFVGNSFADTIVPLAQSDANTAALKAAANDFVDYLVSTVGGSLDKDTVDSTLKYTSTDDSYSISVGNPQYLTAINLNNISFEAKGVNPIIGKFDVTVTLALDAKLATNNCIVNTDGRGYKIVSFVPNNTILHTALGVGLRAHGDALLNKFISSNTDITPSHCAQ